MPLAPSNIQRIKDIKTFTTADRLSAVFFRCCKSALWTNRFAETAAAYTYPLKSETGCGRLREYLGTCVGWVQRYNHYPLSEDGEGVVTRNYRIRNRVFWIWLKWLFTLHPYIQMIDTTAYGLFQWSVFELLLFLMCVLRRRYVKWSSMYVFVCR